MGARTDPTTTIGAGVSFFYTREAGPQGQILTDDGDGPGVALATLLERGPLPLKAGLQLLAYMADIVSISEEDKVVHGNISPTFVKLDAQGSVSIDGYGEVRTSGQAPEGRAAGTPTDTYCVGTVMLAVLTGSTLGNVPRERDRHDDHIVDKLLAVDWGELAERRWMEEIRHFLCTMLAFDPAERPAALDVANILGEVASQTPGEDLVAWVARGGASAAGAEPLAGPRGLSGASEAQPIGQGVPEPAPEEDLGGPKALSTPISSAGALPVRQAASAKGEATAFWTKEKIAALLAEDDEEAAPAEQPVRQSFTPTRERQPRVTPALPDATVNQSPAMGFSGGMPTSNGAAPPVTQAPRGGPSLSQTGDFRHGLPAGAFQGHDAPAEGPEGGPSPFVPQGGYAQGAPQGGYAQGAPQGGYAQGAPQGGFVQGGFAPGVQQGGYNPGGRSGGHAVVGAGGAVAETEKKGGALKWVVIVGVLGVFICGGVLAVGGGLAALGIGGGTGTVEGDKADAGDKTEDGDQTEDKLTEPVDSGSPDAPEVAPDKATDTKTKSKTSASSGSGSSGSSSSGSSSSRSSSGSSGSSSSRSNSSSSGSSSSGSSSSRSKSSTTTTTTTDTPINTSTNADANSFPAKVKVATPAASARLECGDGKQIEFSGSTQLTFDDVTTCRVKIDGKMGVIQIQKSGSFSCSPSGSSVSCTGG